jgi:hypothetical protein
MIGVAGVIGISGRDGGGGGAAAAAAAGGWQAADKPATIVVKARKYRRQVGL